MRKVFWGVGLVGALALLLTGCGHGTTAARASTRPRSFVGATAPTGWRPVGTVPASLAVVDAWATPRTFYLLAQGPATANGAGFLRIEAAGARGPVVPVTPPYIPPMSWGSSGGTSLPLPQAWGRMPSGAWWMAFAVSPDNWLNPSPSTVYTVVWRPGDATWRALAPLVIAPPESGLSAPTVDVVRGDAGGGWVVSDYAGSSTGLTQARVYRLAGAGWRLLWSATQGGGGQPWNTWAAPAPGHVLDVLAAGQANPVWLTATGRVLGSWPIPAVVAADLSVSNPGPSTLAVGPGSVTYLVQGSQIYAWAPGATTAQALISPGSTLSSWPDLKLAGFWRGTPVIVEAYVDGARAAYWDDRGQWVPFPALMRGTGWGWVAGSRTWILSTPLSGPTRVLTREVPRG